MLAAALGVPGAVLAHNVNTPAGHAAEDAVVHTAASEVQLNRGTKILSAWASQATDAVVAADPGQVGQWGPVVDWPVVGIQVALLPNGKVLAWDSVGDAAAETFPVHNFTRATIYDPITGTQTPATVDQGYNIFCSGFAHLFDGTLFIAGGNKNAQLEGIVKTHLFNPVTNAWSLGPDMAAGRWYPSVTPLTNGEMLITSGGPDTPEVRKTDGTLRTLSTAPQDLPLYPWMDVAPDGRVFYSGPDPTLRKLDPVGGGSWQTFGQRDGIDRGYGSHAVYDIGKTLVAGGGPSSKSALVIDTNGAAPSVSATAQMAFGRRQHNLTLLADGSVLATGGNSTGVSLIDMNGGVYNAERWDPATGQWTTLAAQAVTRQYHSTALLLPDGRVLSSGGGLCGTCDQVGYLAKNAEVFSPPYLFKKDGSGQLAPRPEITGAPDTVSHGTSFQITTPNAASIQKVGLIRLGSQTHSVEMEQRYVPLSFTAGGGSLTATVPANVNTAVPGYYMLFIVDSSGVPSVARIVQLEAPAPPPPPPPPPPPASGLVAAYSFNEGIGMSAADSSGKGNTGAIGSASWIPAGKYGNALFFDGSSARVTVNDAPSLDLTTGMTLEAWVLPNTTGGWTDVIYKGPDDIYYLMSSSDSDRPVTGGTFASPLYANSILPLSVWSHLAATFDGATLRLYVNGVQVASRPVLAQIATSTGALTIGGDALYGQHFFGRIDEVRIYNRALSANELQTDMNTPIGQSASDTQAPTAPTGLAASAVSPTQINLAWTASTDNVGVTGYKVERCQGAGCSNFLEVATPAGTSYNDTGLTPATTYRYRVRATDASANLSAYSTVQSATTLGTPDTDPPTPPTGLTATPISANQINLAWTASTDNVGVTGYKVERCQGAGCSNFLEVATPTGASYSDTGLAAATSYSYRVRATDAAANLSPYSSVQSATTQAAPDTQPPTAPSGLTASAVSGSQVNLAWTASTDNVGVTGYKVERCQGAGCSNFLEVATPAGTSYNDTGLTPATTYRYRVRATDAAANLSPYSSVQSATTADTQAPTVPTGLTATAISPSQINLAWTASTDNVGVTGYSIERCQGAGCTDFVQVATPSGTAYNDTLLQSVTSYSYRVRATDAAGNLSPYSSVQSATTLAAGQCGRSSAVWLTGMEHGVVSTAGGGIFSSLTGTPTADNTVARSGAYSLRITDASAGSTVRALRSFTASNVAVTRLAVRLSSLPSVTSNLAYIDSGTDLVFRYNAASQQFQLVLGTSVATSTTTVSPATWYVVDLRYDLSANPNLGDWRVNGVAQTQVSRTATPATANGLGIGATANASVYTANYDDILVAVQAGAYPLEDIHIVKLVPNSMGTSTGAGNFRNNDGTAIDASSWQRLDEVPMNSTADYVRQQANSGTSFLEFGLEDTPETCIRDVSAVLAYHAAGSPADNGKASLFDGATETAVFTGDMSQTALQYKSAVVAPAGGIWNQAALNGLVARVGYSTDSTPNPYWDSVVVEAAVP